MGSFIELDYYQTCKYKNRIAGDVFLLSGDKNDKRIVCTLSDGLGSGVKANVLASLTASMGQKFTLSKMDIRKSAKVIMKTLPVCKERKISYSTFTMLDIEAEGKAGIIEYDNPPYLLIRNGKVCNVDKKIIPLEERFPGKKDNLKYSEINLVVEDRLVIFSDGVSQSGIGTSVFPLGWRMNDIACFIIDAIKENLHISARQLSRRIVKRALSNDIMEAKDDITCAVVYIRKPRKLLILSGPPIDMERDKVLVDRFRDFTGEKVICGGTTAKIISENIGERIKTNIKERDRTLPPTSEMKGADLITEGILTLSKTAELLEKNNYSGRMDKNAATKLVDLLLNTDEVSFVVGTKINEAHQDPNIPVEIGLRRTIINRIKNTLEEKYLKQAHLEYL